MCYLHFCKRREQYTTSGYSNRSSADFGGSQMRRFFAMLVLGSVIPLAAVSAGWAGDTVDYQPYEFPQASQPATVTDTGSTSDSAVVAGQGSVNDFGPYF